MWSDSIHPQSGSLREGALSQRLERRREIEKAGFGTAALNRVPVVLRTAEHIRPLLRAGLKACGLYHRGHRNALAPVVRTLQFALPNLPRSFERFRILHLSDLHTDGLPGLPEALAEVIAPLKVDLCVMTGDYRFETRGSCDPAYAALRTVLAAVRARHGIAGILGNHDVAEMAPKLEAMGVRMLINEAVKIPREKDRLWIAGVDDPYTYECDDLALALENVPLKACKILLAHTPQMIDEALRSGINLYLCGHTHAGQIRLPLVGAIMNNGCCERKHLQGAWRYGRMQGYTNAGAGCSLLPIRFNCQPEVALIELVQPPRI